MFEDYDVFYEPTEAEQIMGEALSNITALFTDEVKRTIDDASKAKENLERLKYETAIAERKLRDAEERLQEMQKRVDDAELYDVPRKYINKFVKNATGGFAPGDDVYILKDKGGYKPCKTCMGEKKISAIVGGEEVKVQCPTCNGVGSKFVSEKVVAKAKVSDVYLKLCFSADRVCYWNTECVYLDRHEFHTDAKRIYRTEEEAVAALEKERKDGK